LVWIPTLFSQALGLTDPWYVAALNLDPATKQLEIQIDFRRGGRSPVPSAGRLAAKAHDTAEHRWRHLDFFQFRTELVARTPRVDCSRCRVHPVAVPWARTGSAFTLLFEALVLAMAPQMPMAAVARLVNEHDTRVWRLIDRHVTDARRRWRDHRVGLPRRAARAQSHPQDGARLSPQAGVPRSVLRAEAGSIRLSPTLGSRQRVARDGARGGEDSRALGWCSPLVTSHISNGVLEGLNSLIQAAKAKARGYRTVEHLITMSYLIAGQLRFNVPHFR
jgi:transposase